MPKDKRSHAIEIFRAVVIPVLKSFSSSVYVSRVCFLFARLVHDICCHDRIHYQLSEMFLFRLGGTNGLAKFFKHVVLLKQLSRNVYGLLLRGTLARVHLNHENILFHEGCALGTPGRSTS